MVYFKRFTIIVILSALLLPGVFVLPAQEAFAAEQQEDEVIVIPDREYLAGDLNQGEEEIAPGETPLSGSLYTGGTGTSFADDSIANISAWSLLNLVLTIATAVAAAVILHLLNKRKETGQGLRVFAVSATIGSFILLDATQNIRLPMGFADVWSPWHILIAAAAAIALVATAKGWAKAKSSVAENA